MNLNSNHWRKKAVSFALGGVILSSMLTMGFNTVMSKEVSLIVDGKAQKVVTYTETVADFLDNEGIVLDDQDVVEPSLDTLITDDMDIIIKAPKSYKITDGTSQYIASAIGDTVGEVIANIGIHLNPYDVVTPKVTAPAKPNQPIVIERVRKEAFEQTVAIAYETQSRDNPEMYQGESKVIQQGQEGVRREQVQNTYVNNVLVSIDVLASAVEQEPVTHVVENGTKEKPKTVAPNGVNAKRVIVMQATAYDPSAGSKTAMGTRARVGAVAVDPRVIPLGTKLYIESMDGFPTYGYAVAEDTGGAIKGNRIDLFYGSHAEAIRFGRRNVKVYVLE
ncbi:3D domain-containing protein [Peptoniphilus equinus]|uniref:3D domain-containing protein n=1 Tax=Peptoniphilus equinus TaxID=3016343 RepID=A0ABY7QTI6_9FIRM|nr:3D domain-containing protein [Peptoniphilus equinus]WBW50087.1 3D domain-containing protein [Peptoniphilus equinus]